MIKQLGVFLISFLFSFVIQAQTVTLSGTIVDQESKIPLVAATIKAGELGTISDFNGSFEIDLPSGDYEVLVSYIGYVTYETNIQLVSGESQELIIELAPSATLLETATVTSGKYEKALGEVTVSLEILQPRLIENTGKTTLDGALQKIPGVNIIDGQANIRGGSGYTQGAGGRVLLLVDDVPILDAPSGFSNWSDVPIENTSQVEVVKGAASALYGSSALNGIINVRTSYATSKPETKGSIFYNVTMNPTEASRKWWDSPPNTIGASLTHKRKINKLDLVLGGYYLDEKSFNQDALLKVARFNFGTQYRLNERLTIGLNGNFNTGERDRFLYWASDSTAYTGAPNTLATNDLVRFNLDPRIVYYGNNGDRHKLFGRFYQVDNDQGNNQSNFSQQYYAEYQFQKKLEDIELVATAGAVVSGSFAEAELYGDTSFTSRNYAAYVQFDKKLFDKLNASFGFRYEENVLDNPGFESPCETVEPSEERESKPVFRLGLNYEINPNTFLRASWGQGYRYPTIAEKYVVTNVGGIVVLPNPDLQSESGWSTEIGIKKGFKLKDFEGYIDISGFLMRYQDMMEFNLIPDEICQLGFQSTNIGDTNIGGFEISMAGRGALFGLPTTFLGGYNYIDPRFGEFDTTPLGLENNTIGQINATNSSSQENILKYRSQHSVKADIETQIDDFSVGVAYFYQSNFEAIDAVFEFIVPGLEDFRKRDDDGYHLFNARMAYQLNPNFKLSFIMNNLFNEVYSVRPGLLESPRNVTGRIDFKF